MINRVSIRTVLLGSSFALCSALWLYSLVATGFNPISIGAGLLLGLRALGPS